MEKNKNILQKMVKELPSFEAPPLVWDAIESELDNDQQLQKAIEELPTYSPPSSVWNQIEKDLEPKVISINRRRWLSIAASIAILVFAGTWYFSSTTNTENIQIAVTEETIFEDLLAADWEEDESIIQEVAQLFTQSKVAQNSQYYNDFLEEFEELKTAKEELEYMMQQYGKAADIVRQISEIELERSTLVKQMATLI